MKITYDTQEETSPTNCFSEQEIEYLDIQIQ